MTRTSKFLDSSAANSILLRAMRHVYTYIHLYIYRYVYTYIQGYVTHTFYMHVRLKFPNSSAGKWYIITLPLPVAFGVPLQLQHAATRCNTLRHTATHCNTLQLMSALRIAYSLQCVAVCCSVLQCVAVCCSVLQNIAVYCSVLQCVAVCCSVLQWSAMSSISNLNRWSSPLEDCLVL